MRSRVTVVIQSYSVSFAERAQYEQANVDLDAYDLIIVKQGYLYPELKRWRRIMSCP